MHDQAIGATGTHTGPFMGHAATDRPIRTDVFDAIRLEDGRMVEHWGVPDRLGALMQLGLIAPPARSPPRDRPPIEGGL